MTTPIGSNIMAQYSAIYMTGEEDVETLKTQLDACRRYIADDAAKVNSIGNWKTLIGNWMVKDSRAHHLLKRPDVKEVDLFFNELIRRQKKDHTDYDPSMRDYSILMCTPSNMDVHYRNSYEFYSKFYDEKLAIPLATKYEQILSFGDSLDNDWFTKNAGLLVKNRLIEQQRNRNVLLLKELKDTLVEESIRRDLQALVAGDPSLFKKLKTGQPITGSSGELADWFQTSILDDHNGKPHDISLRTAAGVVSPLTPCRNSKNNNNNNIINNSPQQQQPQTFTQKGGRGQKRSHQQSNGPQQQQKQSANQQPFTKKPKNAVLGTKYCGWCKHNVKVPAKSIDYSFHTKEECFRNPNGSKYDAARAAVPPKN